MLLPLPLFHRLGNETTFLSNLPIVSKLVGWLTGSKAEVSLTPEPDSGGRKIFHWNLSVGRKKVSLILD